MSRYYCPFCSSIYPIYRTRSDGILICGQCGDPLLKKPLLNTRKIFGFIAASAFLAPLLIMFVYVLKESFKDSQPMNSESIVLLTTNL